MYKHNRKLAAVLAGTLLMLVALTTGCQSKKGNVQGGTSTAQRTSMSSAASSSTTDTRASNIGDDIERGATDIMDDIGTGVSDAVGGVSTVISDVVGDNTNATR